MRWSRKTGSKSHTKLIEIFVLFKSPAISEHFAFYFILISLFLAEIWALKGWEYGKCEMEKMRFKVVLFVIKQAIPYPIKAYL